MDIVINGTSTDSKFRQVAGHLNKLYKKSNGQNRGILPPIVFSHYCAKVGKDGIVCFFNIPFACRLKDAIIDIASETKPNFKIGIGYNGKPVAKIDASAMETVGRIAGPLKRGDQLYVFSDILDITDISCTFVLIPNRRSREFQTFVPEEVKE